MMGIIEGLHKAMTGLLPADIAEDAFGAPGIGTLAGCRVVCGLDRIQQAIPAEYYPAIVLEPAEVRTTSRGHLIAGTATIRVDILVRIPGRFGALFGRRGGQIGILDLAEAVERLAASQQRLGGVAVRLLSAAISHRGIFDQTSPWMGKRIAILDLTYSITKKTEG